MTALPLRMAVTIDVDASGRLTLAIDEGRAQVHDAARAMLLAALAQRTNPRDIAALERTARIACAGRLVEHVGMSDGEVKP